jgi:hypothetical protein
MNINVINDEYFENLFLVDPDKCNLLQSLMLYTYDLWLELSVIEPTYESFVLDTCCPDNGYTEEDFEECKAIGHRINEINKEFYYLLDGTSITKEEYEEAKKNLY